MLKNGTRVMDMIKQKDPQETKMSMEMTRETRSFTLTASRWSLRLKSCSGDLLKDKESMWCNF
jgi:hypothetical protein